MPLLTMRKIYLAVTLIIVFSCFQTKGQPSLRADSATLITASLVDTSSFKKIYALYNFQVAQNLYTRIDSFQYTHVFITTKSIDTSFFITEWYFKSGSTTPYKVYINQNLEDTRSEKYQTTLSQLNEEYTKLKPLENLTLYKKTNLVVRLHKVSKKIL